MSSVATSMQRTTVREPLGRRRQHRRDDDDDEGREATAATTNYGCARDRLSIIITEGTAASRAAGASASSDPPPPPQSGGTVVVVVVGGSKKTPLPRSLLGTAAAVVGVAALLMTMIPCHSFTSGFSLPSRITTAEAFGLSRISARTRRGRGAFMSSSSSPQQSDPTPLAASPSTSPSSLANNVNNNNNINKNGGDPLAVPPPQPTTSTTTTTPAQPVKKKLQPLGRYLEVECWKRHELRDLEPVLTAVGHACKQINRIVQRAQTDDLYGAAALGPDGGDGTNVQGEVQQKLDVVCNTIMLRSFCGGGSGAITAVASEEEDEPRSCVDVMMWNHAPHSEVGSRGSAFRLGNYVAVFDPIDGSANIDSSLPVGTVFGIYRSPAGTEPTTTTTTTAGGGGTTTSTAAAFLQRGDGNLVAAGYCLYSATTVLVLTLGSGVDGFTLDPDYGTFLHTHRDVRIPSSGNLYSFNEANFRDFSEPVRRYLDAMKSGGGGGGGGSSGSSRRATARYVGALVADVHNVLMKGGIYGYPATRANPNGKLRLLYECCPMAMIVEQAGGAASTGRGRILDVQPKEIHQRCPLFLGSLENVYELDQFHRYYGDDDDDGEDLDDDYLIQHVA